MTRTGLEGAVPVPAGPRLPHQDEKRKAGEPAPSAKRRWKRSITVAFTSEEIPQRLRDLALRWGLYAPDGKSPAVSYVVEYLLLDRLNGAEAGEIGPPPRGWRSDKRSTESPQSSEDAIVDNSASMFSGA